MVQIGCVVIAIGMLYAGIQGLRGRPDADGTAVIRHWVTSRSMKFSIRDLLLVTVIVALAVG